MRSFIPIEMQGKWTPIDIYLYLISIAANRQSIHSIQNIVRGKPSETSIRHHIKKIRLHHLEKTNSLFLLNGIGDILPKGQKCVLAIDYTDDPYYGTITEENKDFILRGRCKKSTTYFYRYATIYLIGKDRKVTLAALPVRKGASDLFYVSELVRVVKEHDIKIEAILLDRGFYSTPVFQFLQLEEIPHIVPVKKQGVELKSKLKSRKSRYISYTMIGKAGTVDLKIAVDVQYLMGRSNKKGIENLGYVTYGVNWPPRKVCNYYKQRFSVESSYRMRNLVRPRSSTKNPTLRFLMVLISLLLKNIWVCLRWRYFSPRKRGPRRVVRNQFRFDHFRLFIWHAYIDLVGMRCSVEILSEAPINKGCENWVN
jgi:putative transposase